MKRKIALLTSLVLLSLPMFSSCKQVEIEITTKSDSLDEINQNITLLK